MFLKSNYGVLLNATHRQSIADWQIYNISQNTKGKINVSFTKLKKF